MTIHSQKNFFLLCVQFSVFFKQGIQQYGIGLDPCYLSLWYSYIMGTKEKFAVSNMQSNIVLFTA